MTKDEIIEMASKCLLIDKNTRDGIYVDALIDYAKLVAQHEREACAKVCEGRLQEGLNFEGCAKAIRARGQA